MYIKDFPEGHSFSSENYRKLNTPKPLALVGNADTGISFLTGTLPYEGPTWPNLKRTKVGVLISRCRL